MSASASSSVTANIYIFYHIHCCSTDLFRINIMREQLSRIIFSGLYAAVDKIYCFLANGSPNSLKLYLNVLENIGDKIEIIVAPPHSVSGHQHYEKYTLSCIRQYIKSADLFLYIHTKGITYNQHDPIYENVEHWRTLLEYFLVGKHRECIAKLVDEGYDTVGANYTATSSIAPQHYSGNFWWCKGEHFLSLSPTIGDNYHDVEFYLFTVPHTHYSMFDSDINHYLAAFPSKKYIDVEKIANI